MYLQKKYFILNTTFLILPILINYLNIAKTVFFKGNKINAESTFGKFLRKNPQIII